MTCLPFNLSCSLRERLLSAAAKLFLPHAGSKLVGDRSNRRHVKPASRAVGQRFDKLLSLNLGTT